MITVPVVLAIFDAFLLLLGVIGGNIELKEYRFPPLSSVIQIIVIL